MVRMFPIAIVMMTNATASTTEREFPVLSLLSPSLPRHPLGSSLCSNVGFVLECTTYQIYFILSTPAKSKLLLALKYPEVCIRFCPNGANCNWRLPTI